MVSIDHGAGQPLVSIHCVMLTWPGTCRRMAFRRGSSLSAAKDRYSRFGGSPSNGGCSGEADPRRARTFRRTSQPQTGPLRVQAIRVRRRWAPREEASIARGCEWDLGGDAGAMAPRAVHLEVAVEGLDARREAVEAGA